MSPVSLTVLCSCALQKSARPSWEEGGAEWATTPHIVKGASAHARAHGSWWQRIPAQTVRLPSCPARRRRWVWGALGPLPVTPHGRNEVLCVPEEKGSRTRLWLIFWGSLPSNQSQHVNSSSVADGKTGWKKAVWIKYQTRFLIFSAQN